MSDPWVSFYVNETPHRVYLPWRGDRRIPWSANEFFLDGLDPGYYHFMAELMKPGLEGEKKATAAMAIRSLYLQSLETFFALLFGSVQAPEAVFAWMNLYRFDHLKRLVGRVNQGRPVRAPFRPEPASWSDLAMLVHGRWQFDEDRELDTRRKEEFAGLWEVLAHDFVESAEECNHIKHGFRVRSGGTEVQVGTQPAKAAPVASEKFQRIGGSDSGTTFFGLESTPAEAGVEPARQHHVCLKTRPWDATMLLDNIEMVGISIENVVAFAKNQTSAGRWHAPARYHLDQAAYRRPVAHMLRVGISELRLNFGPPRERSELGSESIESS